MNVFSRLIGVLFFGAIVIGLLFLSSCGPKPQYETRIGKKKLAYYNSIQHGKTKPKTFKTYANQKKQ
ncbi:MAG: hypothetical protein AAF843_04755 [Bacteroidota bacterium]